MIDINLEDKTTDCEEKLQREKNKYLDIFDRRYNSSIFFSASNFRDQIFRATDNIFYRIFRFFCLTLYRRIKINLILDYRVFHIIQILVVQYAGFAGGTKRRKNTSVLRTTIRRALIFRVQRMGPDGLAEELGVDIFLHVPLPFLSN